MSALLVTDHRLLLDLRGDLAQLIVAVVLGLVVQEEGDSRVEEFIAGGQVELGATGLTADPSAGGVEGCDQLGSAAGAVGQAVTESGFGHGGTPNQVLQGVGDARRPSPAAESYRPQHHIAGPPVSTRRLNQSFSQWVVGFGPIGA